jgi:hypothetical protein
MKKIYVLLGATFFSTLVFSQKNTAIKMRKEKNAITEQMPTPKKEHQTKVTIWSNDLEQQQIGLFQTIQMTNRIGLFQRVQQLT